MSVRRIPGLDQLYLYDTVHGWQPNPNLKPEIGSSWTVGADVSYEKVNPIYQPGLTFKVGVSLIILNS